MNIDEFHERIRFQLLRLSTCTAVHVERRRREIYQSWLDLRAERDDLARDQQDWFDSAPRPVRPEKPFCFVLDRMKRVWRERDRRADIAGFAVHRTVGSTAARQEWFRMLSGVIEYDEVIRVRHRSYDEPVILLRESRFRALERETGEWDDRTGVPSSVF